MDGDQNLEYETQFGIILTFYYQMSFWWKEKLNLLQNLWPLKSLLDYFAIQ